MTNVPSVQALHGRNERVLILEGDLPVMIGNEAVGGIRAGEALGTP